MRRGAAGFSLLELVVAMALFALVATIGAQTLSTMLRARDTIDTRAERASQLAQVAALLRADLAASVPALDRGGADGRPGSALAAVPGGFALSIGGQPWLGPGGDPAGLHRVQWRLDGDTLLRQVRSSLRGGGVVAPAVPMLEGVDALRLRSHWPRVGWIDGAVPPGGDAESVTDALPRAIPVTVFVQDLGAIPIRETLR